MKFPWECSHSAFLSFTLLRREFLPTPVFGHSAGTFLLASSLVLYCSMEKHITVVLTLVLIVICASQQNEWKM